MAKNEDKRPISIIGVPIRRIIGYTILLAAGAAYTSYNPFWTVVVAGTAAVAVLDLAAHLVKAVVSSFATMGPDEVREKNKDIKDPKDKSKDKSKDKEKEEAEYRMDNTKERAEFVRESDETRAKKEEIIQAYRKAMMQDGVNKEAVRKDTLIKLCALCHSTGQSFDVPLDSGNILQFKTRGNNDSVSITIGLPIEKNGRTEYKQGNTGIIPARAWTHGKNPSFEKSYEDLLGRFDKLEKAIQTLRSNETGNKKKAIEIKKEAAGMDQILDLFTDTGAVGKDGFGRVEAYDDLHKDGELGRMLQPNDLKATTAGISGNGEFIVYAPPLPDDCNLKQGDRLLYKYIAVQSKDQDGNGTMYDLYKQTIYQGKDGEPVIESNVRIMHAENSAIIGYLGNTTAKGKWTTITDEQNENLRDTDGVPKRVKSEDVTMFDCYYSTGKYGHDFGYAGTDENYATPDVKIYLISKSLPKEQATEEVINQVINQVVREADEGKFRINDIGKTLECTEKERGVETYHYGENVGHVDMLGNEKPATEPAPQADIPSHTNEIKAAESLKSPAKVRAAAEKDKKHNEDMER